MHSENLLRRLIFRTYRRGYGPSFTLTTFYTGRRDELGKSVLRYRLTMREGKRTKTLFCGEDYHVSPLDPIDSDAACAGLLWFLTLRPGDTDPEYFENYTDAQLAFANKFAEALACEVDARFGEEASR